MDNAPSLEEITEIETRYSGRGGTPSLGEAFLLLQRRWDLGHRDRETSLRVAFLAWYSCSEPTWLTGLPSDHDIAATFTNAFAALGGVQSSDPEVCFAIGTMAKLFPWCIGDEQQWLLVGTELLSRQSKLLPLGFSTSTFAGRGAYGDYFAHMAAHQASGS